MDELKKLLGDELFVQVEAKLGGKLLFLHAKDQKVLVDDGKMIPKHRLDEVIEEKKAAEKNLTNAMKQVEDLKAAAVDVPGLTKKIEQLQTSVSAAQEETKKTSEALRRKFALKESLMNAGVADPEARELLALKLDSDKVVVTEDGKVQGFDDLVKPYKENKAFATMFGKVVHGGQIHGDGETPDPALQAYDGKNPFKKGSPAFSIATQSELTRTQPELAKKLREAATV
jgi:hypothetical protein